MRSTSLLALVAALAAYGCVSAQVAAPTLAPSTAGRGLVTNTVPLEPFHTVSLCAPLNVLIQPGNAREYGAVIDGEEAVVKQISANVSNEVLAITLGGPINTTMRVQITVMLPPDQLAAVRHNGPGAELTVGSGFTAEAFTAVTGFGAGELYVTGLTATNVSLDISGYVALLLLLLNGI